MTAAVGYPKLRYRALGGHQYEVSVQASPRAKPVPMGTVTRSGSLPSMQAWRSRGNWTGAEHGRARQSRGDAGADLWSAWRAATIAAR